MEEKDRELPNINWFPGHMVTAHRTIRENLKLVDVIIELLDARIPYSSRNPLICELVADKPHLVVLNKADLADEDATQAWLKKFRAAGTAAVAVDAAAGKGLKALVSTLERITADTMQRYRDKGLKARSIRAMILGIPNVGKSSLINRLAGAAIARTADKPGVTRNKQWIRLNPKLDLLDTPGVLWPKFEEPQVGLHLAFTGAINDEVYDRELVVREFLRFMGQAYLPQLTDRYKLNQASAEPDELLRLIGSKRGCLLSGGVIDEEKTQRIILTEFRAGKLGRITLERAE